jgi:rubrerythrin
MIREVSIVVAASAAVVLYLIRFTRQIGKFVVRYRKMKRRWRDECESCGYNLRGNVSGICPECGAKCGNRWNG